MIAISSPVREHNLSVMSHRCVGIRLEAPALRMEKGKVLLVSHVIVRDIVVMTVSALLGGNAA